MYESGALEIRPLAVFADGDLAGVGFGTGFGDLVGPFGFAAAPPGDFVRAGLFTGGRPFGFAATFGFAFSIFSTAFAAGPPRQHLNQVCPRAPPRRPLRRPEALCVCSSSSFSTS